MTFTITQEHLFPASPGRVFDALTNSTHLTRWFAEQVDVSPVTGGKYRFWGRHTIGTPSPDEAQQVITQLDADQSLSFTWPIQGIPSDVDLHLEPRDAGTRLLLAHTVCGELREPRPRALVDDAWRLSFANLSAYLTGGDGVRLPDYGEPSPRISHHVRIDAPPSVVFRALIEPPRINRWFGSTSASVEPHIGGRYDIAWHYKIDGRDVVGGPRRILDMVPDEKLVLDWPDWRGDPAVPDQTISFALEPNGLGGTSVAFTHEGFTRAADMSDFGVGWLSFLEALRKEAMAE